MLVLQTAHSLLNSKENNQNLTLDPVDHDSKRWQLLRSHPEVCLLNCSISTFFRGIQALGTCLWSTVNHPVGTQLHLISLQDRGALL